MELTEKILGFLRWEGAGRKGEGRKWRLLQVWVLRALGSCHFLFEGPVSLAGPQLQLIMNETNGTKAGAHAARASSRAPGSALALRRRGQFCPLGDLTLSQPWARKLSSEPLRALAASPPARRGLDALCGAEAKRPGEACGEAAGRGASPSLPARQRVRPAPQVSTPGSPAPGQGLAVPPHLWRDRERSRGETALLGAPKTTPRQHRLSRKVSVSALRAHGNPWAQGAPWG